MNITELYLLETLKSFKGLKSTAESAISQLSDDEIHFIPSSEANSVAIIIKHLAGNMISRWTDFLSSDGEKPDRNRDNEFIDDIKNKDEFIKYWNKAWNILFATINSLKEEDILKEVFIRGELHTVLRAMNRQLVHYAYHTGQIVYLAKMIKNIEWKTLSIPRGKSE
ncbi:MAG: DUF1572 family protein, partial [Bacteroidia bacterium]